MKDIAYAKINLALDVCGIREDGYHELRSIMVPISLYDELEIEKSDQDRYECNVPLSFDHKNTVVKAIDYIKDKYNIQDHFNVKLRKYTPSQAGLGGGSSDGASALRILNQMYGLNMNEQEIKEACLSIGADVLFTYYNKPAVVTGLGDELEFINMKRTPLVLIAKPPVGVSTKAAYDQLNMETCAHPDIDRIRTNIEEGKEYRGLIGNSLEEPSIQICPRIQYLKDHLKDLGASCVLMSGSGSAVFVLSYNYELLRIMNITLRKERYFSAICRMIR